MKNIEFYQHIITRQWRWRVRANNGKIIGASSESYWNRKDCEHNLEFLSKMILKHNAKTV
jgi:uncharacterized protein YegP (UPF0339 family)